MRASTKLSIMVGLLLTMSTSAGAVVSITLTQVGGTYQPGLCCTRGDTLILEIGYSLEPGDTVSLIDPALVFNSSLVTLDPEGSTETAFAAWSGGGVALNPVATGDIGLVTPGMADGWEKSAAVAGGAASPCVFGACSSLGTASFVVISPWWTLIQIGGVGQPGGTVILDGDGADITAVSNLGTFTMMGPTPEPTTASLLALGLLGLAAVRRRRRTEDSKRLI